MAGISGRSGRKKLNVQKIQICTSLEPDMYSKVEDMADVNRWTIAGAISYCIELGLENYEKDLKRKVG